MDFSTARFKMVEQQVRPWEVIDPAVLECLSNIPRHKFVPEGYQNLAYSDTQIPLGDGQLMMAPKIEARLLQALAISASDKVLEIGTGSGFLAALLTQFASEIISIEINESLHKRASERLAANQVSGVSLECGDALDGWAAQGPYDVIAVTGSSATRRPVMEEQLKLGGRMFIVVGKSPVMEALLIHRVSEREWREESLFETELTPLQGAEPVAEFRF
ncbi:MAG: protein-L-isoaspartate O-methyltransferase [Pseudomonadota bacterium]